MLLNAEQEATNLRGQAEREADLLVNEAKREMQQGPYGYHSVWKNIDNFYFINVFYWDRI